MKEEVKVRSKGTSCLFYFVISF